MAQDEAPLTLQKNPPMRNVFFNVLWGSMAGGMTYVSLSILDDSKPKGERYSFKNLTSKFILGATGGGLLGLAAGAYFSLSDISFDPNRSRISQNLSQPGLPDEGPRQMRADQIPLLHVNVRF